MGIITYAVINGEENRWGRTGKVARAATEVFTAPVGSPVSQDFTVYVNGDTTACYETYEGSIANFCREAVGFTDITVEISFNPVVSVDVYPSRHGIIATVLDNQVTFSITELQNYVVVVDDDWTNPLYICANPIEEVNPSSYTYYYGPGYYNGTLPNGQPLGNVNDMLILGAGQSAYFHGGAYFRGKVQLGTQEANRGPYVNAPKIHGYGVVDSFLIDTGTGYGRPLHVGCAVNAEARGITFIGRKHWGAIATESDGVLYEYTKMLNFATLAGETPDGMDIIGSKSVYYKHCLIRAHDDSIAIKTWKNGFGPSPYWRGNVDDILVEDVVLVQGNGGNGLEIGYENFNNNNSSAPVTDPTTNAVIAGISNITYRRVDLVRKERDPAIIYRMAALGIHLVDDVPVSNVLYEDVNVEYCDGQFWIWFGSFATGDYPYGTGRAQIDNVTLRRVNFDGPNSLPIHLQGGGSGKTISNLTFEDVYVRGSKLTNTSNIAGKVTWEVTNTDAITFL